MIYKYKCECLINQNKYIGDDPVGHCCYNDADFKFVNIHGITQFICKKCLDNYVGNSDEYQVTLEHFTFSQEERVSRALKAIREDLERCQ